jgi:uncharacterized membrane protein
MRKLISKLIDYFIKGLLIFVPVAFTLVLLIVVFTKLDGLLRNLLGIEVWGLGFLLTIVLIFVIGFLGSNFLGKKFFGLVEKVFRKLPLVKLLFSAAKDVIEAFAGEKKSFDKPVLATIVPGAGAKVVGFVTRESLANLGLSDYVAVYLPQSYNFAGNVLLLPKESVEPLEVESSQAMAFVVSGGVSCGSS